MLWNVMRNDLMTYHLNDFFFENMNVSALVDSYKLIASWP